MRFHSGQEADQRVDHAADIHAHDPVPIIIGGAIHRTEQVHPGAGTEDVHVATKRCGTLRGVAHCMPIGHVHAQRVHAELRKPREVLHRLLERRLAPVGEDDFHAGPRKRLDDAEPYAACTARNEGHFIGDVLH